MGIQINGQTDTIRADDGSLILSGEINANVTGNLTGDVTGNVTGTATTAQGLTGTPNVVVGIVTATEIAGVSTIGVTTVTATTLTVNGDTKLRITSAGQVGIGSTVPRADLDVPGGGAVRLNLVEDQSLSGSTVDITGVPAWATKIVVAFYRMSASTDNEFGVRLGTTSGVIDTNYDSTSVNSNGGTSALSTNRFVMLNQNASHDHSGQMIIEKVSDARYVETHMLAIRQDSGATRSGAGFLELVTETIDRLQIFLPTGTFDNGTVTVYVE